VLDGVALAATGTALEVAADSAPLLAWQTLTLGLRNMQPVTRRVALGALKIDGAELQLARDAKGRPKRLSLLTLAATAPPNSPVATAAAPAERWRNSLDALRLKGGQVHGTDDRVQLRTALQLTDLRLQATGLRWPTPTALPVTLSNRLRCAGG
jgi:hypothetical protein